MTFMVYNKNGWTGPDCRLLNDRFWEVQFAYDLNSMIGRLKN